MRQAAPPCESQAASALDALHLAGLQREFQAATSNLNGGSWVASAEFMETLSKSQVGVIHRSSKGTVLAVNAFYQELIGREDEDFAHINIQDHAHPEEAENILHRYRENAVTRQSYQMNRRYVRSDGTERWGTVHVSFLQDGSSIGIVLDETIRRQAEADLRESEEHYRNTVELSPQYAWTTGLDGKMSAISSRWLEKVGAKPGTYLGDVWRSTVHPDNLSDIREAWARAQIDGQPIDVEYRANVGEGYRWFRSRGAPRLDEQGNVVRWYGAVEDIDDRKRAEQALRESEERFRLAAQAAGIGIWDFDTVQNRWEWSAEFKQMLGLPNEVQPDLRLAMTLIVAEDRPALSHLIRTVEANASDHRFEAFLRIHRADDDAIRCLQINGWRIQETHGRVQRVLVTLSDVTEQHNSSARMHWMASHDALTGLPNRGSLNEALEAAITQAREKNESLALVMFDIDGFKEANDTIGHDAGDLLLCGFAKRLERCIGDRGFVARFGGDEFAAFLPRCRADELVALLSPALQDDGGVYHDGIGLDCNATAGAAFFPDHGDTGEDLLKTADVALYAGKASHRGMLTVFRPDMRASIQHRAAMLATARRVINEARVRPFYQPKVSLAGGHVAGFEALLRWQDADGAIRGPDSLSAAFEDLSLAPVLGERMLEAICRDMAHWLNQGLPFGRVAINLSPAEFRREDLFDRVMSQLHRHRVPPSLLELEVTETVFLGRGAETVADVLRKFHDEGLSLALDDFGTGYASLTHLQAFPVDVIKIDRSFVTNLSHGSTNAAIVDAIIGLAGRLGMDVIAEGIETQSEADYLIEHGCGFGQGYLFGAAIAGEAVERRLMQAGTAIIRAAG